MQIEVKWVLKSFVYLSDANLEVSPLAEKVVSDLNEGICDPLGCQLLDPLLFP